MKSKAILIMYMAMLLLPLEGISKDAKLLCLFIGLGALVVAFSIDRTGESK